MLFADELREPGRRAYLRAVGLAVVEDLDVLDGAGGAERDGERDELMLADDLVDDEPAAVAAAPGPELIAERRFPGILADRGDLRRCERAEVRRQRGAGQHLRHGAQKWTTVNERGEMPRPLSLCSG
ncbi:MAG: hypothetical protein QM661_00570 [Solimonas sp.]